MLAFSAVCGANSNCNEIINKPILPLATATPSVKFAYACELSFKKKRQN